MTIRTMTTARLLELLPAASATLRLHIEAVLKTRITPVRAMPCIAIGR